MATHYIDERGNDVVVSSSISIGFEGGPLKAQPAKTPDEIKAIIEKNRAKFPAKPGRDLAAELDAMKADNDQLKADMKALKANGKNPSTP